MAEEKSLGQTISEQRMKMGLTQTQLAAKVGCSGAYISSIESSKKLPAWGGTIFFRLCSELNLNEESISHKLREAKLHSKKEEKLAPDRKDLINAFRILRTAVLQALSEFEEKL